MKIIVAILNYNGKKHLEHFLPSVLKNSDGAEIVIIDNASTDDSVEFLKKNHSHLRIVQNLTNGGFAQGYNEGLQQLEADIFVLLNSDVEVTPGWITPVAELLMKDEKNAAAQPKILSYIRKTHFEHAGAAGGFIDKDGYPFCRGRIFNEVEEDIGQYNVSGEIFWATGACMFIKAKCFKEENGFDAGFFAHMEEIDLCWRLKNRGYKMMYCADSKVYHLGGGTLNYESPRKTYLNFRNNLYAIHKNYNGPLFLKLLRRKTLDGIAGVVFLLSGKYKHAWMIMLAHFHYYRQFSQLNRKREYISATRKNENLTGVYDGSVTYDFFVGKKKRFSDLKKSENN
ncbi:MAG: glycosyltransferase family 2 protein [Bacteroidota bacterium]